MLPVLVPPDKPPRLEPRYSPWRGPVRALGMLGFLLLLVLGAMVVTEGRVPLPVAVVEVALLGFGAFLLAWWLELVGGLLLTASMILAAIWTPLTLESWRPWFLAVELFLGVVGVLLILLPRAHS